MSNFLASGPAAAIRAYRRSRRTVAKVGASRMLVLKSLHIQQMGFAGL
jgi:hypothetical protein